MKSFSPGRLQQEEPIISSSLSGHCVLTTDTPHLPWYTPLFLGISECRAFSPYVGTQPLADPNPLLLIPPEKQQPGQNCPLTVDSLLPSVGLCELGLVVPSGYSVLLTPSQAQDVSGWVLLWFNPSYTGQVIRKAGRADPEWGTHCQPLRKEPLYHL